MILLAHGPRELTTAEIMTPEMANFTGNIHGGHLMRIFDKVAYACAAQYASLPVVTLAVDQVIFKKPIHVSDLLICKARVNFVGRTSMEVGIHVEAENLITQARRHTNTCFFTMVALKDGKTVEIPQFKIEDEKDRQRFEEAKKRREFRLKYSTQHSSANNIE